MRRLASPAQTEYFHLERMMDQNHACGALTETKDFIVRYQPGRIPPVGAVGARAPVYHASADAPASRTSSASSRSGRGFRDDGSVPVRPDGERRSSRRTGMSRRARCTLQNSSSFILPPRPLSTPLERSEACVVATLQWPSRAKARSARGNCHERDRLGLHLAGVAIEDQHSQRAHADRSPGGEMSPPGPRDRTRATCEGVRESSTTPRP